MALLPRNSSRFVLAVGASLLLGGCADYMNNRDSVTLGVGNANFANTRRSHYQSVPAEFAEHQYRYGTGNDSARHMTVTLLLAIRKSYATSIENGFCPGSRWNFWKFQLQ